MVNVTHLVVISVVGICHHFRASVTDCVCICVQWEYYFTDHTGTLCLSFAVSALSFYYIYTCVRCSYVVHEMCGYCVIIILSPVLVRPLTY